MHCHRGACQRSQQRVSLLEPTRLQKREGYQISALTGLSVAQLSAARLLSRTQLPATHSSFRTGGQAERTFPVKQSLTMRGIPTVSLSGPAFLHKGCQAGHECLSVSLSHSVSLGNKIKKLTFAPSITLHLVWASKKALQCEHCLSVWWRRLDWR